MTGLIAHDWIERRGGAERVLEQMVAAFPGARLTTLWNDDPQRFGHASESWLARTPLRGRKQLALPLMPTTWSGVDAEAVDWVLASSHAFAHHVGGRRARDKFVYVHTPARYVWAPDQDPRGAGPVARAVAPVLRRVDLRGVSDPTSYAANSRYIAARIAAVWGRSATVIHPPVDTARLRGLPAPIGTESIVLGSLPTEFILGASRFVRYKRLDLVIAAGERAGMPVVLAGDGPLHAELARRAVAATVPVRIVVAPSDAMMSALLARAAAFVFPAVEDFGILPAEAMALGTPAVVFAEGGSRESVDEVGGGVVVDRADPDSFAIGVRAAASVDMGGVPERVEQAFGAERFRRRLREWIGVAQ
jgi:glycosyltransferase involved in cell wall biosynthesis